MLKLNASEETPVNESYLIIAERSDARAVALHIPLDARRRSSFAALDAAANSVATSMLGNATYPSLFASGWPGWKTS